MPGRPEFSQPGTQGGGQTVAVNDRPKLTTVKKTNTDEVPAGQSESTDVYAPSGAVYNVVGMSFRAKEPSLSGATTGTHQINIYSMNQVIMLVGKSDYQTEVYYNYGAFQNANQSQSPSDATAQAMAPGQLMADENGPITFTYINSTDVATTETREYTLVLEQRDY